MLERVCGCQKHRRSQGWKRPLGSSSLLIHTDGKYGEGKARKVIFVCRQTKHAVAQPAADGEVGYNPRNEMSRAYRSGASPVQGCKGPGLEVYHCTDVHGKRGVRVARVGQR
jgi:hypothetical protein